MITFLVTATIQFEVECSDNGDLWDKIYMELGYNVETYSEMVLDELREHSTFEVSSPAIKQI